MKNIKKWLIFTVLKVVEIFVAYIVLIKFPIFLSDKFHCIGIRSTSNSVFEAWLNGFNGMVVIAVICVLLAILFISVIMPIILVNIDCSEEILRYFKRRTNEKNIKTKS